MSALDQTIAGRGAAPSGYTRQATFVFILGMHRSGTSCLAGSLERCGLFLGDVSRSNVSNPRGTHELSEVRRAHGQRRFLAPPARRNHCRCTTEARSQAHRYFVLGV
jgi:hypothetical protein